MKIDVGTKSRWEGEVKRRSSMGCKCFANAEVYGAAADNWKKEIRRFV